MNIEKLNRIKAVLAETGKQEVNKDFTSPSTAAIFVGGNNYNGWIVWKTAKGEPLDLIRNKG
mgnify:CR=1 FL=1